MSGEGHWRSGTGNYEICDTCGDEFSPEVDVLFGQNKTVSLIAKGVGGTGSGICTMRIGEDW